MDYTITLTETEKKAMEYITHDVDDWITNAAIERARHAKEDILRLVSPEVVTGSKNLKCSTGFDYVRSVDLVSKRVDNKVCKKVYFDARIRNTLGKVWGYSCK